MLTELALLVGSLGLGAVGYILMHRRLGWTEWWHPFTGGQDRPFADLLPLEDIQNAVYILTDGSYVGGYELQGVDTAMKHGEDIAREMRRLNHAFNALNVGVEAIVHVGRTKDVTSLLLRFDEVSNPRTPERLFLKRRWRQQLHRFAKSERAPFLDTRIYIFLRVMPEKEGPRALTVIKGLLRSALAKRYDPVREAAELREQHRRRLVYYNEQTRAFVQMLSGTVFDPRRLSNAELDQYAKSLLWSFETMSNGYTVSQRADPNRFVIADVEKGTRRQILRQHPDAADYFPASLRSQIASVEYTAYPDHIELDGRLVGVMRMFMAPDRVQEDMLRPFRDFMQFPCTYSVRIVPRAKQAELDRMRREYERKLITGQTKTVGSPTVDSANVQNVQEAQQRYMDAQSPDRNPFGVEITFTYEARDLAELKERADRISNFFLQMADCRMMRERFGAGRCFLETLPFSVPKKDAARMVLFTDEIACLLPLFKPWAGAKEPVRVFRTVSGEPFSWDPVDRSLVDRNGAYFGRTGSGKGFVGQTFSIFPTLCKGDCDYLIIDSAGTYRRSAQLLGGVYYDVSDSTPEALNCFALPPSYFLMEEKDRREFLRAHIGTCKSFVATLANPQPDKASTWEAIISEVVNRLLREAEPTRREVLLRDVYSALVAYKNPELVEREDEARRVAMQLRPYIHHPETGEPGQFARLLDRPQAFDLDTDYLVLDFNRISKSDPVVLTAYLIMVVAGVFVQRVMKNWSSADGRYTRWLGDEVAKYLGNPRFREEFMRGYREFRKQRSAAEVMLQSLNDLALPENRAFGTPVKEAAGTKIYLQHTRNEDARKAFEDDGLSLLADTVFDLDLKYGEYSEVVVQQGAEHFATIVIVADPFEYWASTTNPEDTAIEIAYSKKYGPGTPWNLTLFEHTYLLSRLWPNGTTKPATVTGIALDRFPPDGLVRQLVEEGRAELDDCRRELARKGITARSSSVGARTSVAPPGAGGGTGEVPASEGGDGATPGVPARKRRARSLAAMGQ